MAVRFVPDEFGGYWDINGQQFTEDQLRRAGVNVQTLRGNDETWQTFNGQTPEAFLPGFAAQYNDPNSVQQVYNRVAVNEGDAAAYAAQPGYVTIGGKRYMTTDGVDLNNPGIPSNAIVRGPDGKTYIDEGLFYAAHPELTDGSGLSNFLTMMPMIGGAVLGGAALTPEWLAGGVTEAAPAATGGASPGTLSMFAGEAPMFGAEVGALPSVAEVAPTISGGFTPAQLTAAGYDMGLPYAPTGGSLPVVPGVTPYSTPTTGPADAPTTPASNPPVTPTPSTNTTDIAKQIAGAAVPALIGAAMPSEEPYDPSADLALTQEQLEAKKRQAALDIDSAFGGFNDDYYAGLANAYKNYQMPRLDEQFGEARRALPLRFKSTANSSFARRSGELQRDYDRGQTDIAKQGEDVAAGRRGEVERERGNLLSQAEMGAGLDTTAQQAASVARGLAQPPAFSPIGDLFAKYTANAANARLAADQGYKPVRPLLFGRPTGGRGSVSYGR